MVLFVVAMETNHTLRNLKIHRRTYLLYKSRHPPYVWYFKTNLSSWEAYLSSVSLLLLGLVPLQVGLLQGESAHPAAQREEEDGERGGGRAETPQRLEVTRVLRHSQGQV